MRSLSVWLSENRKSAVATVLGSVLVLSLLLVVAFAILPTGGSNTTEFYVLGPDGTASGYPENVTVGETVTIQVGIANHESNRQTYTLVAQANETVLATRTVAVNREERWEGGVSVAFETSGRKQLQLQLYTGQSTSGQPYRSLQLFLTVRPS